MNTLQFLLLALLLPLTLGPIGHHLSIQHARPDLFLVACWTFSWFFAPSTGWRWALLAGLSLDLLLYTPFGLWTGLFVLTVFLIHELKSRWLETSSALQALASLAMTSVVASIIVGFVTHQIDWPIILISAGLNTLIGLGIFYVFGTRLKLFQRWAGSLLQ